MLNRIINIIITVVCSIFGGFFLYNYVIGEKYVRYVIVFEEPVNGLLRGSQVLLNGIKVGRVYSMDLAKEDPSKSVVIIYVKPINPDILEAQIMYLGISGNKGINLYFKKVPEKMPQLNGMKQIKSSKSILSKIFDSTDVIDKSQIEKFVASADEILRSIKKAITGINKLIDSVNELVVTAGPVSQNILILSENLTNLSSKLLPAIAKISKQIENEKDFDLTHVLENLRVFSYSIKELSKKSESLLQQFSEKPIRFILRGMKQEQEKISPFSIKTSKDLIRRIR